MIKNFEKYYKIFFVTVALLISLLFIPASAIYQETVTTKYGGIYSLITGNYSYANFGYKTLSFTNGYALDHKTRTDTTTALDVVKFQSRHTWTLYYKTW